MDEQNELVDNGMLAAEPSVVPSTAQRAYESNTEAGLRQFAPPQPGLQRGIALEHTNGDVFVVTASLYRTDLGPNATLAAVELTRTRDQKKILRGAETMRLLITQGTFTYADRYYRPGMRLEITYRTIDELPYRVVTYLDDEQETN